MLLLRTPTLLVRTWIWYRWRRDTLVPYVMGRRLGLTDTCAHISDACVRVASWNMRGLLGSTASGQGSRERKHRCLQRLCESNGIVCLQKPMATLIFYMRCLPTTRNGIWWDPRGWTCRCKKIPRYSFGKRSSKVEAFSNMRSRMMDVTTESL